ncbi:polyprenyl synthetase family protein [Streptomyces sp. PCS3-D2]|uniref:polyprenyl synthetase family protein n=1 Tax=Streptomyces sp. PCS3-D2 TaxID=1460244 RepID=UPI000446F06B|nr:polyprenyl synthetase family protein [Streptomyces sp. PCS3-D2]WKV75888.1 polyprenyl synthetase family protein [Streptomyces sp. PCS3-D2]
MRRTQAKDQTAAAPPPVPRLVAPSGSAARRHPTGSAGVGTGHGSPARDGIASAVDPAAVDVDVPAAIGSALEQVLGDRLTRSGVLDAEFAGELAARVARFTREGGKRTRSQLLWWSMRACGGDDGPTAAAALRIGAALELLQTCALVHDDVMDGSVLRRGRPALHTDVRDGCGSVAAPARAARFGEAVAVLAGDLALAWADDVMAEAALDPWTASVVREVWSDMRTEMVAGQFLDLRGQLTGSRSPAQALRAARLKSALYSVERPLALGAAVAGADGRTRRALCSAGRCVGMAFQLRDDLEDVFGDPRHTGKSCGGDIRTGKPTYLAALAVARAEAAADRRALEVLQHALGKEDLSHDGLDEVREVLVRTGARAAVEARIERLSAQGMRHFDGAGLTADAAGRLRGLLTAQAASRSVDDPPAPSGPTSAAVTASGAAEGGR